MSESTYLIFQNLTHKASDRSASYFQKLWNGTSEPQHNVELCKARPKMQPYFIVRNLKRTEDGCEYELWYSRLKKKKCEEKPTRDITYFAYIVFTNGTFRDAGKYKVWTQFDRQIRKYQGRVDLCNIGKVLVNRFAVWNDVLRFRKEAFRLLVSTLREQKQLRMQEAEKRAHLSAMRHVAEAFECLRCEAKRSRSAQPAGQDTPAPNGPRS